MGEKSIEEMGEERDGKKIEERESPERRRKRKVEKSREETER